jgi:hypothetical protein
LEKFGGELPDLSHQRVWWMADAAGDSNGSDNEEARLHFTADAQGAATATAAPVVVQRNHQSTMTTTATTTTADETAAPAAPAAPAQDRVALLSKRMVYRGVEESLASLESDIETRGPFVGVLGFAQGATMAALLVERLHATSSLSSSSSSSSSGSASSSSLVAGGADRRFRFAVFISGYPPRDDRYVPVPVPVPVRAGCVCVVVAHARGVGAQCKTTHFSGRSVGPRPLSCQATISSHLRHYVCVCVFVFVFVFVYLCVVSCYVAVCCLLR